MFFRKPFCPCFLTFLVVCSLIIKTVSHFTESHLNQKLGRLLQQQELKNALGAIGIGQSLDKKTIVHLTLAKVRTNLSTITITYSSIL